MCKTVASSKIFVFLNNIFYVFSQHQKKLRYKEKEKGERWESWMESRINMRGETVVCGPTAVRWEQWRAEVRGSPPSSYMAASTAGGSKHYLFLLFLCYFSSQQTYRHLILLRVHVCSLYNTCDCKYMKYVLQAKTLSHLDQFHHSFRIEQ